MSPEGMSPLLQVGEGPPEALRGGGGAGRVPPYSPLSPAGSGAGAVTSRRLEVPGGGAGGGGRAGAL